MASAVVSDNFETSSGAIPQLGGADVTTRLCSAWVNFNGSGTVAIRASYNVSSITDNGTGDYTANFTNVFLSTTYSVSCTSSYLDGNLVSANGIPSTGKAVGSVDVRTSNSAFTTRLDHANIDIQIFS